MTQVAGSLSSYCDKSSRTTELSKSQKYRYSDAHARTDFPAPACIVSFVNKRRLDTYVFRSTKVDEGLILQSMSEFWDLLKAIFQFQGVVYRD